MINDYNYTPEIAKKYLKLGTIVQTNKEATLKLKLVQSKLKSILKEFENRRARNGFYDISFTDNSYMYSKTNQVVNLLENNLEFICDINDARVDDTLEKEDLINIYKKIDKVNLKISEDKCTIVERKAKVKPILINMKKIIELTDKLITACKYANNVKDSDNIKFKEFDMKYQVALSELADNNTNYIKAIDALVTLSTKIKGKEVKDGR